MKETLNKVNRCRKCGKPISHIIKIDTGLEYQYKEVNLESRYIDNWGYERNFCKDCMK